MDFEEEDGPFDPKNRRNPDPILKIRIFGPLCVNFDDRAVRGWPLETLYMTQGTLHEGKGQEQGLRVHRHRIPAAASGTGLRILRGHSGTLCGTGLRQPTPALLWASPENGGLLQSLSQNAL